MKHRAFVLLVSLAHCAPLGVFDDGDRVPPPSDATNVDAGTLAIEVGGGYDAFEPLTDGAPVDIILGPQGGHHIWTSLRVSDTTLDHVLLYVSARFADNGASVGSPSRLSSTLTLVDGARERLGLTNFVDDPAVAHGRRIVLRVEVQADDGRIGVDERAVVAR